MSKKFVKILIVATLVSVLMAGVGSASAWSGCGPSYKVAWGDTLYQIAAKCGTTMDAIRQANPGLGEWVYAGQVLVMPGYYGGQDGYRGNHDGYQGNDGNTIYIVAPGDTLRSIAMRFGTTVEAIARLNNIYNYNWIYVGQRLRIPGGDGYYQPYPMPPQVPSPSPSGYTYIIQPGDTLKKLAFRWGVSIWDILAANPQITNANLLYVGQAINIPLQSAVQPTSPSSSNYYTVQFGDTLKIIAARFGTSVYNLLSLNPQLWNPDLIYVGSVIRVY